MFDRTTLFTIGAAFMLAGAIAAHASTTAAWWLMGIGVLFSFAYLIISLFDI